MRRLLNIFLVVWVVLGLSPAVWGMPTMRVGSLSESYTACLAGHCTPDFTFYDANCYPASSPNDRFEDGPNTYDYVGQNPWTKFDPEGLATIGDYENDLAVNLAKKAKIIADLDRKNGGPLKSPVAGANPYAWATIDVTAAIAHDRLSIENITGTAREMEQKARLKVGAINERFLDDAEAGYKSFSRWNTALKFWPGASTTEHAMSGEPGAALGSFVLEVGLTAGGGMVMEFASTGRVTFAVGGKFAASGGAAAAESGVLANANFAQKTFSATFSSEGAFAGRSIEDIAAALRSRQMSAADVPVQYIVRDGNTLMLNTRSAQALEQAGIPRNQWNAVNMTGDAAAEARLTGQLQRNGLTSQGTPTVTPGR